MCISKMFLVLVPSDGPVEIDGAEMGRAHVGRRLQVTTVRTFLSLLLALAAMEVTGWAATYYVDFESGSDSNPGTSTGSPWKHAKGDANATGVAASGTLLPGDTVFFKGGVIYRGKINSLASGSAANRITYDGAPAGWGTGKAIIDGTQTLSWTRCTGEGTGSTEVQNANFANIYYASLPSGGDWRIAMFESGSWLMHSGTDNQADPWFYNNTDYFRALPSGVGATATTDPAYFNQTDPNHWVGAVMMVHITGNAIGYQTITGFNPSTDTVSYPSLGVPYADGNWDGKYHYAVINGQRQFTGPGQYAVDQAGGRILVWPRSDINEVTVGSLNYAFHTSGCSYNTIRNFVIRGQTSSTYGSGRQITGSNSTPTDGLLIEFCDISNSQDGGATAAIYTFGAGQSNNVVHNCTLTRIYGRGIFGTGNGFTFQSNELSYVTGTVLYSQNHPSGPNINGQYLDNYIHDCSGVHANGMTIYGGAGAGGWIASNFLVARNRVIRQYHRYGPFAVSVQGHKNIQFENNVLDGGVADDGAAIGSSYIRWYNNVVTKTLRIFRASSSAEVIVRNNILIGGMMNDNGENWAGITHSHNIFVTPNFRQEPQHGFVYGTGETLSTLSALFINAPNGDYRLAAESPARDAGSNLSSVFLTDVLGRPRASAGDIGAYEESADGRPVPPPNLIRTAP